MAALAKKQETQPNPQIRMDFGVVHHVSSLHSNHKSGISFARIVDEQWHEFSASQYNSATETAKELKNQKDAYMAVNGVSPFRQRSFLTVNYLTCNFVDLDVYNVGVDREKAVTIAISRCLEKGLPLPTKIVDSGRGLYLIWIYEKPTYVGNKNDKGDWLKSKWTTTQDKIVDLFSDLGADPRCKDIARVLRLAGTINSKSDNRVTVYDLSEKVMPIPLEMAVAASAPVPVYDPAANVQVLPKKNPAVDRKPKRNYSHNSVTALRTTRLMVYRRMKDLRTLAELRGGKLTDHREMTVFYYAISAAVYCNTRESLLREVSLFMYAHIYCDDKNKYDHNRPEKLLTSVLRKHKETQEARINGDVEVNLNYKAQSRTIIRNLEITLDEQTHLVEILSIEEKDRRRSAVRATPEYRTKKRKKQESLRRAKGEVPREEYEAAAKANREQALKLKQDGLSYRKIAKELGVSLGAVQNYLKQV